MEKNNKPILDLGALKTKSPINKSQNLSKQTSKVDPYEPSIEIVKNYPEKPKKNTKSIVELTKESKNNGEYLQALAEAKGKALDLVKADKSTHKPKGVKKGTDKNGKATYKTDIILKDPKREKILKDPQILEKAIVKALIIVKADKSSYEFKRVKSGINQDGKATYETNKTLKNSKFLAKAIVRALARVKVDKLTHKFKKVKVGIDQDGKALYKTLKDPHKVKPVELKGVKSIKAKEVKTSQLKYCLYKKKIIKNQFGNDKIVKQIRIKKQKVESVKSRRAKILKLRLNSKYYIYKLRVGRNMLGKTQFIKRRRLKTLNLPKNQIKPLNNKDKPFEIGILRIMYTKRNIFLTIASYDGLLKYNISCGFIKVKGRKRHALYIVKAITRLIVKAILKHNLKNLLLKTEGKTFKKKKRVVLSIFSQVKSLRFFKTYKPSCRSHNGCRRKKPRRK